MREKPLSFLGTTVLDDKKNLPLHWVDREQCLEQKEYFELTHSDLVYHSQDYTLSARSLLEKNCSLLGQAITRSGCLPRDIIDATCGYSMDSLSFLKKNITVTGYENNPFALVFIKYFQSILPQSYQYFSLNPTCFSKVSSYEVECLYLDPMFDDQRKRRSRLSMYFLKEHQSTDSHSALLTLINGIKKGKANTIVVKSSKRQPPLIKGFASSYIESKSIRYWRFYTNYQELKDEHFVIE